MHLDHFEKGRPIHPIAREGVHHFGNLGTRLVRLSAHECRNRAGQISSFVAVVGQPETHQKGPEIGVAQPQRSKEVAVARNRRRRVVRGIHDDLLGENRQRHCALKILHLELPVVVDKRHQVQACKIAGRVVEEHILRAGVTRIDATRLLDRVPAVDRGVVLDAGIAADVGRLRHFPKNVGRPKLIDRLTRHHGTRRKLLARLSRLHEGVRHSNRMIRILEEDGVVRATGNVETTVVACVDERPGLFLLGRLAANEFADVGMIHVQDHHLRRAARLAARFDDPRESVEPLHEGNRARGHAAPSQVLPGRTDAGEVGTGARPPLEEHGLGFREIHDRLHGVVDRIDETGARLLGGPLHAQVEPHRTVEGNLLVDEDVGQLV